MIEAPAALIQSTLKKTISNVIMGLVLILITVLLFVKIKIVLLLLPIAFFLIGYLFLFNNHFSKIKSQQIWFNAKTNEVFVEQLKAENYAFNIFQDVQAVQKIESVQTTRGLLYGYYRIKLKDQLLKSPICWLKTNRPTSCFLIPSPKTLKLKHRKEFSQSFNS
ncbi:hypothetical protein KUH03_36605 [Sphingobacterium sp. E70]|uniref:hypothetical protein n=1 Tax=Sphingobacterium sp. E70 TaxID=2853439 RepID=UPI00211CC113|nr:hypothetical protein [Sphingobacterium sp. E70]ULT24447.1 hypothetical protein KUH03_36605 [Sphingobacterium sp. E70]